MLVVLRVGLYDNIQSLIFKCISIEGACRNIESKFIYILLLLCLLHVFVSLVESAKLVQ